MSKGISASNELYKNELERALYKFTGIEINNELSSCNQNSTALECPIHDKENKDAKDFVVVLHNPSPKAYRSFARVKLETKDYQAKVWSKKDLDFIDVSSDIFEQPTFTNKFEIRHDFTMFVPVNLQPNEITFIKVE